MRTRARTYSRTGPSFFLLVLPLGILIASLAAVQGCSRVGQPSPLSTDEIEQKLPSVRMRAETGSDDFMAQLAYGLALYQLERYEEAQEPLSRALVLNPRDFVTGLVLADVYRETGRKFEAADLHEGLTPGRPEEHRFLASARERLRREFLEEEIWHVVRSGKREVPEDRPVGSIAVLDFDVGGELGDEEVWTHKLAKALSAALADELAKYFEVTDRARVRALGLALSEYEVAKGPKQQLLDLHPVTSIRGVQQRLQRLAPEPGSSPFYDGPVDGVSGSATRHSVQEFQRFAGLTADGVVGPRTRQALQEAIEKQFWVVPKNARPANSVRVGELLGVRMIVECRLWFDDSLLHTQAELIDVIDGATVMLTGTETAVDAFSQVPTDLSLRLASAVLPWVSHEITIPAHADTMLKRTEALDAFAMFGEALALEDRGLWREAASLYADALAVDPALLLAANHLETLAVETVEFDRWISAAARSALGL